MEKDLKVLKEMIWQVQYQFAGKNMHKLPIVTSVLTYLGSPNTLGVKVVKVAGISNVSPMHNDSF